ncbi:GntR family transcriptional regulator [Micromonospora haikouensis]|uniref:GntR family transcriptional regulator n=1 Tax=Micromonospora haikouensis TaxID=686309 RepID=UPI00342930CC
MTARIDPVSPVPRYRRLAVIPRNIIEIGEYLPGSRLPSEKTLSQAYGVARETASKAMDALAAEHLAVMVPGVGWHVPPEGAGDSDA